MALPSPAEVRADRLLKVVQAYTLTEDMPTSTKKNLTDHCRGILLLVKSFEERAAVECVLSLKAMFDGTAPSQVSVVYWPEVITRRCDDLLAVVK